jgi:phosphoglycolate phosphatase/pyrophosphatase PpaX
MSGPPVHLLGAVFDLDGTIAETFPMAIELIGDTIAAHGGPRLSAEEIVARFGPNEQGILRDALGSGWEAAWECYLADYVARHDLCPDPFPGMAELIRDLHGCGCRIGLVTGKTATTATISLEQYGLARFFDGVEGGSRDGIVKDRCIGRLAAAWGLDPARMAYVGDTAPDVTNAHQAGVLAVAAGWSEFADRAALDAAGADARFDDVAGFAAWVRRAACGDTLRD